MEKLRIYFNLCSAEFGTEIDMIKYLEEHMQEIRCTEPFFSKLCGIGLSERYAINQLMMNHVENVLKEDVEAKETTNKVIKKLATIIANEDELEKDLDTKMKMILITS